MLKVFSVVFFGLLVGMGIAAIRAVPGDMALTLTVLSAAPAGAFMATMLEISSRRSSQVTSAQEFYQARVARLSL